MIHPTAVVHPEAKIGQDVDIGAYAVIDGPAIIGDGCKLHPHAYVSGWVHLEERCEVHPFAAVGGDPQDTKFEACDSYVHIGPRSSIREFVTIHRGSDADSVTRLGSDCMLMAKAHIAHDCCLGNGVMIANNTECAGHVLIGDNAFVSGHAMIHQFTRIGRRVMIAPLGRIRHDIPPFFTTDYEGAVSRVNVVGLRRAHMDKQTIDHIKMAFKRLYRSGQPLSLSVEQLAGEVQCPEVLEIVQFIKQES